MRTNFSIRILLASCFPKAQAPCSLSPLQNCQGCFENMDALNLPLTYLSTQDKTQGSYHSLESAHGLALATSLFSVPSTPAGARHSNPHRISLRAIPPWHWADPCPQVGVLTGPSVCLDPPPLTLLHFNLLFTNDAS